MARALRGMALRAAGGSVFSRGGGIMKSAHAASRAGVIMRAAHHQAASRRGAHARKHQGTLACQRRLARNGAGARHGRRRINAATSAASSPLIGASTIALAALSSCRKLIGAKISSQSDSSATWAWRRHGSVWRELKRRRLAQHHGIARPGSIRRMGAQRRGKRRRQRIARSALGGGGVASRIKHQNKR